jgi:hypothetical protein
LGFGLIGHVLAREAGRKRPSLSKTASSTIIPQVEMGQGTYTSLPMVMADELDAESTSLHLAGRF